MKIHWYIINACQKNKPSIIFFFLNHTKILKQKDRVFLVQGGYVSQSNNKTLTVSKKGNVLNKIPPRGPKGAASGNSNSANNNNNQQSALSSGMDVSIFFYCILLKINQ